MATEINVIADAGPAQASASERALAFETLAATNRALSYSVVDAFAAMYESAIAADVRAVIPTIPELLLRHVIEGGYNLVMPIITGPTNRTSITGGAFPRMIRAKVSAAPLSERADVIKVRFDRPITCVWVPNKDDIKQITLSDGIKYIAPPGEEIEVIGIRIEQRAGALDPGDRLATGRYTYADIGVIPLLDHTRRHDVEVGAGIAAQFIDALGAQVARLALRPNARSIHNALDIAFAGRTGTSIPARIIDAALVRRWPGGAPALPDWTGSAPFIPSSSLISAFEAAAPGRFTLATTGSIYADMTGRGLARLYHRAVLAGLDSTEVREGLAAHALARERALRSAAAMQVRESIRSDLEVYRMLIARLYGAARLGEIDVALRKSPVNAVTPGGILTLLKPAERKVVDAEFKARARYIEESAHNNCPHVSLHRQLRRAVDDRTASALLAQLRDFMVTASGAPTALITCKRCKHDIMCPHTRDYLTLDLAGKPQPVIKAALMRYWRNGDCKICGEALSNMVEFDAAEERAATSSMDEELRNMMWGEIAGLTRHLKWDTPTDVRALIVAVREAIYQHIFDLEKQVIKSKTANESEIKAKLRLYVAIYAMAYLVRVVERGGAGTGSVTRFRDYGGKNTAAELIKHGLDVIMSTRNVVIREIPGMSLDVIKNALVSAYKLLTVTAAPVETAPAGSLMMTLLIDPIYNYYYLFDLIASKRALPPRKHDREDQSGHIMGADVARLERIGTATGKVARGAASTDAPPNIYAHVVKPKLGSTEPFDRLTEFRAASPIGTAVLRAYAVKSFEWFDHKQRERAFDQHQYIDVAATDSEVLNVRFRPLHQALSESGAAVLACERVVTQYRAWMGAQPYGRIRANPTSRRFVDPKAPIGRVFDETGAPHRWTKYVVKTSPDAPVVEMTARQIAATVDAAAVGKGEPVRGAVVDRKCAHCGQLESAISALSEDKIRAALRQRHDRSNFFRFYEHRCPAGGIHDRAASSTCAKCGLVAGTTPDAYFLQHIAGYALAKRSAVQLVDAPPRPMPDTSKYAPDYVDWTHDFAIVVALADKIGVNHRLLSALGATGGVQYADILSGEFVPGESYDRQSTRAGLVNSHVQTLFTEYNRLRYYSTMLKPPHDLAAVVDGSDCPRHLLPGLASALPDVYDEYNEHYLHVSMTLKPREIVEFCVQSFCQRALRMWGEDTESPLNRLRHDFVRYVVKKILRGEELMTKPGPFNWSLLYGDGKEKSYDSNTARDEPDNADAPEDTDDDPLTMDAFDVEDDDEDDPSNTVRVED